MAALNTLHEKWEVFDKMKLSFESTAEHIQVSFRERQAAIIHDKTTIILMLLLGFFKAQAQQTATSVQEEFEKLHHFLRVEEATRLAALKREEERKSQQMSEKVEEVARNMTALSETIRAIEEEMEMENLTILHVRSLSNVCGVLKLSHVNHSSLKLLFSVLQKCKTTLLRYVPA